MTWYPDLGRETMVAAGEHIRAIGWLSAEHPYAHGTVPSELIVRLQDFVDVADQSGEALGFPLVMGPHRCEFCSGAHDSRNFGVPSGKLLFVTPAMIGHYVADHGYAPPPEFIAAVMACPLPGTPEYRTLALPFQELQQAWYEGQQRM